jgi:hypothetical protein
MQPFPFPIKKMPTGNLSLDAGGANSTGKVRSLILDLFLKKRGSESMTEVTSKLRVGKGSVGLTHNSFAGRTLAPNG